MNEYYIVDGKLYYNVTCKCGYVIPMTVDPTVYYVCGKCGLQYNLSVMKKTIIPAGHKSRVGNECSQ
jgi:hypothetical protein